MTAPSLRACRCRSGGTRTQPYISLFFSPER